MLAACSGGGSSTGGVATGENSIIQRFRPDVITPGDIRLPFSLASRTAEFITDGPDELRAQITDLDGNAIGEPITAVRRDVTPGPYYAFLTTITEPGFYSIVVETGPAEGANFEVTDPSRVAIPQVGSLLPGFDTPTVGDAAGVDPICTREPDCEFHSITLSEALATGKPVAYFIGTPAYCATGSCTPALEALVEAQPDYADDMVFVHAEVWTDTTASVLTPAVEAVSLPFEPALFVTDASGTLVERIDGLWDTTELRERLDVALAR
mgnify:CR=1 FL=1